MDLRFLRDNTFVEMYWDQVRPVIRHLLPEYAWDKVRTHTLQRIEQERAAGKDRDHLDEFFLTYPSIRLVEEIHDNAQGVFMSEILEDVAYRAGQALCALAGLIRLEAQGPAYALLQDTFNALWCDFTQFGYGHGYGQGDFRASLIMLLSSANVFDLAPDKDWQTRMLAYFESEQHPWGDQPLRDLYPEVIRALGGIPEHASPHNSVVSGVLDLEARGCSVAELAMGLVGTRREQRRDSLPETHTALRWAHRPPASHAPDGQRVVCDGPDLFNLPYHLMRVKCAHLWAVERPRLRDPLHKVVLHFLVSLDMRTLIAQAMPPGRDFTAREAAAICGLTPYTTTMTLGQMIREGLAEFDRGAELAWNHPGQTYRLLPQAGGIAGLGT